jgi:hypothetical protein
MVCVIYEHLVNVLKSSGVFYVLSLSFESIKHFSATEHFLKLFIHI